MLCKNGQVGQSRECTALRHSPILEKEPMLVKVPIGWLCLSRMSRLSKLRRLGGADRKCVDSSTGEIASRETLRKIDEVGLLTI